MTPGAIRSAYSYLRTRTDPSLHECSWRCWFWGMLHPGVARLVFFTAAVSFGYFVLQRPLEVALVCVVAATAGKITGRVERNLEIKGLPRLWAWIERRHPRLYSRLPKEPPLRPLDVEKLGWRRYLGIKVIRWASVGMGILLAYRVAERERDRRRAALPFAPQGRHGGREAPCGPGAAHLQGDGRTRRVLGADGAADLRA